MNRKVSILMGIYNCAKTLPQAVDAIRKQTYTNWELILCDDGSTDNTYDVAQALALRYAAMFSANKKEQLCRCNSLLKRFVRPINSLSL